MRDDVVDNGCGLCAAFNTTNGMRFQEISAGGIPFGCVSALPEVRAIGISTLPPCFLFGDHVLAGLAVADDATA